MMDKIIRRKESSSYEETLQIAKDFAAYLRPGDIVCLDGDLGAGKTAFTKGLTQGLGFSDRVTSPTFTILQEYSDLSSSKAKTPGEEDRASINIIYHFDAYRLQSFEDFVELGFEDLLLREDSISVIEWADRIYEDMHEAGKLSCIRVILSRGHDDGVYNLETGDSSRSFVFYLPEGRDFT